MTDYERCNLAKVPVSHVVGSENMDQRQRDDAMLVLAALSDTFTR